MDDTDLLFRADYLVPVDAEDVRSFGACALCQSGPVVGGGDLGLSRGESTPLLCVLI